MSFVEGIGWSLKIEGGWSEVEEERRGNSLEWGPKLLREWRGIMRVYNTSDDLKHMIGGWLVWWDFCQVSPFCGSPMAPFVGVEVAKFSATQFRVLQYRILLILFLQYKILNFNRFPLNLRNIASILLIFRTWLF